MKKLFTLILMIFTLNTVSAFTFETIKGKEIKEDKIIIHEFFFYGCPHCQNLNNDLKNWLENYIHKDKVKIVKVPVHFSNLSYTAARHFYTSELLEIESAFSVDYYYHAATLNKKITDDLAIEIMKRYADETIIKNNINSNFINKKAENSIQLTKDYDITDLPSIVVNGKFKINASILGNRKEIIPSLEKLIEREIN